MVRQDAEVQSWLLQQEIVAAFSVPIRVRRPRQEPGGPKPGDEAPLAVGGLIVLWLDEAPTPRQAAAIRSILRRVANFTESAIDRAIHQEPIPNEEA
jgi:hypothetical protein